jgi:hypothetical protein
MVKRFFRLFPTALSREQTKDSGMAVVLILLLVGVFTSNDLYLKLSVAALLINMIYPRLYYPFAVFWFGLSKILGSVVSRILLVAVYFVIVMPVALVRQIVGKDPLILKGFKRNTDSVMKERNHIYGPGDLEKPF